MALGTITNISLAQGGVADSVGSVKMTVSTVVGDSAYSAGGTTLTGQQLGLPNGVVIAATCQVSGSASNNGAISASYNLSTGKLQMWASTGTSPVGLVEAGSVNLSGITVTIVAFGY